MTSQNERTRTHSDRPKCKLCKSRKRFSTMLHRAEFLSAVSLSAEARKWKIRSRHALDMCNRQTKVKTIAIYYFQNNLLTTVEREIPKKSCFSKRRKIWEISVKIKKAQKVRGQKTFRGLNSNFLGVSSQKKLFVQLDKESLQFLERKSHSEKITI